MIIVRTELMVLPGKNLELTQTLLSMIEPFKKEMGCLNCSVFSDLEDKYCYNLVEEWNTREDLNRHFKSDLFGVLLGLKTLLHDPLEIQISTVINSEGKEVVDLARSKRA